MRFVRNLKLSLSTRQFGTSGFDTTLNSNSIDCFDFFHFLHGDNHLLNLGCLTVKTFLGSLIRLQLLGYIL